MKYEPTNIISRIQWCRLQHQLHSFTREEREGWRAEEAGLVDALGCRDSDSFHAKGTPVSVYALSMRFRGWGSPPPPQHFISQWRDKYGGAGTGPLNDHGPGGQTSLTRPSASACGVSTMICLRCGGLVVQEYLLDSCEGSLSGFHGSRCVNCGAIHDDVIRLNQRVPPSLKGFRSPRRRFGPHVPKRETPDALATLGTGTS